MNQLFIILITAVVFVSGCTIPGLDFGGGQLQSKYENDIVVIKDQSVFPQSVKAGQSITLTTYVQNLGEKDKIKVNVFLFDTCGVFNPIGSEEQDVELLPREVKEIKWTLTADPKKVLVPIPSCKLKTSVEYEYTTSSQTEVYFINKDEAQRQQEQGRFVQKSSVPQKSEGPLVAYILPDPSVRQPIPDDLTQQPASLYIENKGSGFLSVSKEIKPTNIAIKIDNAESKTSCTFDDDKPIKLIQKKSPPIICTLVTPKNIQKEKTVRVEVTLKHYKYEFRKESTVTIEPLNYQAPPAAVK